MKPIRQSDRILIEQAYAGFNARRIPEVLALMHADVDWPKGMEGGTVHGHDAVRAYWTRQWTMIDPRVEPREISMEPNGDVAVRVRQWVRDLQGGPISDGEVRHVYRIEHGLIRTMRIE